MCRRFPVLSVGILALFIVVLSGVSAGGEEAQQDIVSALQSAQSTQQVEAALARLSDGEIRALVIDKLSDSMAVGPAPEEGKGGFGAPLKKWLHAIDKSGEGDTSGGVRLLPFFLYIPAELWQVLLAVGDNHFGWMVFYLVLIVVALGTGAGAEHFCRRFTKRLGEAEFPPGDEETDRTLIEALLAQVSEVVNITIFAVVALAVFFVMDIEAPVARGAFMAVTGVLLIGRFCTLLSTLACNPDSSRLRLLPLQNTTARLFHQGFCFLAWYLAAAVMAVIFFMDAGMSNSVGKAFGATLGTVLILVIAIRIYASRKTIAALILESEEGAASRAKRQLAAAWHVLALLYLFAIWSIWINTLITAGGKDNGALIISLLIAPIFLILDSIGVWLVGTVVATLGIREEGDGQDQPDGEENRGAYLSAEEKEQRLRTVLLRIFRTFIVFVLGVWLLTLWGFEFPYAGNLVKAAFDILITLTLALFFWRFVSGIIERKLVESMPEEEDEPVDDGGEFGAVKQLGRRHTLLPMIRKFIATTLMIMVTLIILSSIGVDIGPLLAGAGVVGLAVGFGAQKLVSDVLSGIFYLMDDAFRVGEYIQAGSVKGAVENITLRNVMLRHHRGMLQIVPHSELGSITNFMRGGIVVKFNLEFPYDTDVELVRKTIKKVGQAMLLDEELGDDFILPVKSQGVYEITNSVMVIRVKFTAKPGRQFLIRREAYRRITEALNKKGVFYAHRKVIVEVPGAMEQDMRLEQVQRIAEAGAAAGQITEQPSDTHK